MILVAVGVGVGVGGDGGALGLSHGRAVVVTLTAGHTTCGSVSKCIRIKVQVWYLSGVSCPVVSCPVAAVDRLTHLATSSSSSCSSSSA